MNEITLLERTLPGKQRIRRWRTGARAYDAGVGGHDGVEVTWVQRSTVRYEIGRAVHEVPEGSFIVVPANLAHRTYTAPNARAVSLLVRVDRFDEAAEARSPGARAPRLEARVITGAPALSTVAAALEKEAFRGVRRSDKEMTERLGQLLLALVGAGAAERGGPFVRDARIRRALDCLHDHYADSLGIEGLSRAAAMSRFHFSRVFREQVGMSPYRYLRATRVKKAASLLRAGRANVTEAARDVGFPNLGRFIRAFRAEFGVSPGEFARSARGGARA